MTSTPKLQDDLFCPEDIMEIETKIEKQQEIIKDLKDNLDELLERRDKKRLLDYPITWTIKKKPKSGNGYTGHKIGTFSNEKIAMFYVRDDYRWKATVIPKKSSLGDMRKLDEPLQGFTKPETENIVMNPTPMGIILPLPS
jgi:hypothetical protein